MADIPDNLKGLHAQEEQLRNKALELVAANTDLADHVAVLETAMDLIHFFISDKESETDDDRAIQYLGIRVFNSLGAAWKLISAGYFQSAAMSQRDIIETVSLVNFFQKNPGQVAVWRTADEKTRRKLFSPSAVRTSLDAAMGKGPSKRGAIYAKFSKLATHASIEGFAMLKPRGVDWAAVGPFMDVGMLRALLEEHARLALQAGMAFNLFLPIESAPGRRLAYRMIWGMMDWMERYHGTSYTAEERDRTRALLDDD